MSSLRTAILKEAMNQETIEAHALAQVLPFTVHQIQKSICNLRMEGAIERVEDCHYAITAKGRARLAPPPIKTGKQRWEDRRREKMQMLALPIVAHAQLKAPASVWAYARGFA